MVQVRRLLAEVKLYAAELPMDEVTSDGELAAWFDAQRLKAHVSVTDETDYAASFVVVEKD